MQLVRVIEVGMDVDGDGHHDLDPSRIYYFGQSFGANYGSVFLAVEPSVRAGVLTVAGDPLGESAVGGGQTRPGQSARLSTAVAYQFPRDHGLGRACRRPATLP